MFLWSPVALTADFQAAVGALGPVVEIVAPNSLHHLFVLDWMSAYPDARIHAAPRLSQKRKDLNFDAELGDLPDSAWAEQIDQVVVRGNLITTEVTFFHRSNQTVLVTDLLQQFPPDWFSGWRERVARADRMVGSVPQVPRKFCVAFFNRTAARKAIRGILDWPIKKVLMAHGLPVERDGHATLSKAFKWLKP